MCHVFASATDASLCFVRRRRRRCCCCCCCEAARVRGGRHCVADDLHEKGRERPRVRKHHAPHRRARQHQPWHGAERVGGGSMSALLAASARRVPRPVAHPASARRTAPPRCPRQTPPPSGTAPARASASACRSETPAHAQGTSVSADGGLRHSAPHARLDELAVQPQVRGRHGRGRRVHGGEAAARVRLAARSERVSKRCAGHAASTPRAQPRTSCTSKSGTGGARAPSTGSQGVGKRSPSNESDTFSSSPAPKPTGRGSGSATCAGGGGGVRAAA